MPRNKWATTATILSGALGGVCVGITCLVLSRAGPPRSNAAVWILEAVWIACGISWDRARGGTGTLGGALGGLVSGLAVVALILLLNPREYALLGALGFCFAGAWGLMVGAGLGLNVWLYLGKPFLKENASGMLGMLQKRETWGAAGLFLTGMLFMASAIIVCVGRRSVT